MKAKLLIESKPPMIESMIIAQALINVQHMERFTPQSFGIVGAIYRVMLTNTEYGALIKQFSA